MLTGILKAQGLYKSYKDKEVLHNLDLTIEPGKIYGLIGRNGAGKTTLLGILTAQNTKDRGEVTYDGQPVWENQAALDNICFSRELQPTLFSGQNNLKIRHYLRSAAIYYPGWDREYAQRLLEEFKLDEKKKICQLSKGQMSISPRPDGPSWCPLTSSRRPPPSLSGSSSWMRAVSWKTAPPRSWWASSATSPAMRMW